MRQHILLITITIIKVINSQGAEENTSEYKACTKIHSPTRGHCRVSPVQDGWRCCPMTYIHANGGELSQCGYIPENKELLEKYISDFELKNNVKQVQVNCKGYLIKINYVMILLMVLFLYQI